MKYPQLNTTISLLFILLATASASAISVPANGTQPQPLPAADLSGLDPQTRQAILQALEQLSALQAVTSSDASTLANAYARVAAMYQDANIDGSATVAWHNAATLRPDDYRWRYYQGWQALSSGHIPQALRHFAQTAERQPSYAPLALRIGQARLAANQLPQAKTALQQAAANPGLRAAALYNLGQIAVLERDYGQALKLLEEALQLAPDAAAIHYPLAQTLRGLGRNQQARQQLALFKPDAAPKAEDPLVTQLTEVAPSAPTEFNAAMQAVRERDYQTAIIHFAHGLIEAPDAHHARTSYARALWLAGNRDQAIEQLQQVIRQQPDQPLAHFMLGLMIQHNGDKTAALRQYQQTIALDPNHQGAQLYAANLLFERAKFQQATEHYRAALNGDVELRPARLLALVAAHHAGRSDQALATELQTLIEQHPDQPELRYALLRLQALSKDPGVHDDVSAVNLANELLRKHPGPAQLQALALAVAANGQFEVAADIQQQLIERLQSLPNAPELQPLRDQLDAYQRGQMPTLEVWPLDDPLLQPIPFQAEQTIREYLAPTPI